MEVYGCDKPYRLLVCGRGWGKDHLAIAEIRKAVSSKRALRLGRKFRVTYVGPSWASIRDIAWDRLKAAIPEEFIEGKPNETKLEIRLKWGPVISLRGSDKVSSRRGPDNHLLIITEFAFCKPETWTVLKPTLRWEEDRALIISSPNGPNHAWELFKLAERDPRWAVFQKPTWDNPLHNAAAVEADRKTWARHLFDQEYGARFEAMVGAVYRDFSVDRNVLHGDAQVELDRELPRLFFGQDFNAGHYTAVIGQVREKRIEVVDEIISQSIWEHRRALVEYFRKRGIDHHERVMGFIDASGDFQGTNRTGTHDADILREVGFDCRHDPQNPAEIDRIHAVQSLILPGDGKARLVINERCTELIRCLMNQKFNQWFKPDKRGGLDHLPDALGYWVWGLFPIRQPGNSRSV